MDIQFEGKRALVTGGANGIGKTIAQRLVMCGAKVFVLDKNTEDLDTFKRDTPEIDIVTADLRQWNEAAAAIRKCLPIQLLENNAGVIKRAPLLDIKPEDIDNVFAINYKASFLTAQVVIRDLVERQLEGSVINVASCHSMVVEKSFMTYSNSKAALQSMTQSLALECGPFGIRVNSVHPSGVNTAMIHQAGMNFNDPRMVRRIKRMVPLQQIVTKDDVADAVVFLLSDRASKLTGVNLPVDCGLAVTSKI